MSKVTVCHRVRVLEEDRGKADLIVGDVVDLVLDEADKYAGPMTVTVTAELDE